jgi:TP901 family phage tail tape measure protein
MAEQRLKVNIIGDASKLTRALNTASGKLQAFGKRTTDIGKTLSTRLTLPLGIAGAAAIKMAADFDKSMTQIKTLVGIASDEVDQMGKAAVEMAKSTGVSAKEAADALFFITSAGLRGGDAMAVLEQSLKASAIGLGETKIVADLATSALNAYGIENLSASQATDVLTAAVREGKLSADSLSQSMGTVLPIASQLGVEFSEVGATFAAMSRTGTDAAMAATQIRGVLFSLLKPSEQAKKTLKEFNLSAEGLRKQIKEEGLLSTLKTLTETFGDNEEAQGKVFANTRALSGVLDLMGNNLASTEQIFQRMNTTAGITAEAFTELEKSTSFQLNKSLKNLQNSFTEIGAILLRSFTPMIEKLAGVITKLSPKTIELSLAFAAVAAALPIILTIAGSLITVFGALLTPVGLIAAGLTAIAVVIYKEWEGFKTVLVKIANYFINLYNESLAFRMIIQGTISYFKAFYRVAKTAFSTVWNIIKGFVANSVEAFKGLGTIITGVFTFDVDLIKEGFKQATEAAFSNLENIASEGGKLMDEASKIVAEEFTDGFKKAYEAEPLSNIVESDIQNLVNKVGGAISGITSGFAPAGGSGQPSSDQPSVEDRAADAFGGGIIGDALSADPIEQLATSSSWDLLNKNISESRSQFEKMDKARAEHQEKMKEFSAVVGGQLSGAFSELGGAMVSSLGLGEGALGSFTAAFLGAALDAVGAALSVSVANAIAGASAGSLLAGPVAPIVLPALIAGMVGLVKSQFASVPKFANGGIVSGPTLGLMGEYPGSKSNPEVIAPLDKLQGMMGQRNQNVNVGGEFKINGQDLVVALQRADRNRSRIK